MAQQCHLRPNFPIDPEDGLFHQASFSPVVEVFSEHGCTESDRAPYPMILHSNGGRSASNTIVPQLQKGLRFGFVASSGYENCDVGKDGVNAITNCLVENDGCRSTRICNVVKQRCAAATKDRGRISQEPNR